MAKRGREYMYKSLKQTDGTYTLAGYLKRVAQLTGFSELRHYFNDVLPDTGAAARVGMALDYYWCLIRYGATVCDYFEYEFWKKRACVRKQYITKLYSRKIQKRFNTGSIKPLSNKLMFDEYFREFRRGIRCFSFDGTEEAFLEFVRESNRGIIVKPVTGFSGGGIFVPDVSTDENARALYRQMKAKKNHLAETLFHQTGVLHEIHPHAVNTIRVYTLYDGRDVHIMYAAVRFGGSDLPVDNIHTGGMACEVDLQTGYIIGKGYDLKGHSYFYHPRSGRVIPGTKVPNWSAVREMVTEAAKKLPEVGYIGWDVADSDDALCLIEGNECANVDASQVSAQRGLKDLYKPFL